MDKNIYYLVSKKDNIEYIVPSVDSSIASNLKIDLNNNRAYSSKEIINKLQYIKSNSLLTVDGASGILMLNNTPVRINNKQNTQIYLIIAVSVLIIVIFICILLYNKKIKMAFIKPKWQFIVFCQ